MISATDALLLSRAQLTAQEKEAAALLALEVDAFINARMERRGCTDFATKEKNSNVIAEVNQRLRKAGWNTKWMPLHEKTTHIGWTLDLVPSDAAYNEAAEREQN